MRLSFYFVLFLSLLCGSLFGQPKSVNIDSLFHEHLSSKDENSIQLGYFLVVYNHDVDLFIYSEEVGTRNDLIVKLSDDSGTSHVLNDSNDFVVFRNLEKDKIFNIEVGKGKGDSYLPYKSNLETIRTSLDGYSINLSSKLYRDIGRWSSTANQDISLPDFLNSIQSDHNVYEIVYFLQKHYRLPEVVRPDTQSVPYLGDFFSSFPPERNDSNGETCYCSFTQNSWSDFRPGKKLEDGSILTETVVNYHGGPKDTYYFLEGNGAAKRMKLSMRGKHGTGKYEASTTGVGTDYSAGSPFYARLSYNFVCTELGTELPQECECPKKISVEYGYTTSMRTSANKGGGLWVWSAGAEAVVEDHVLLMVRNGTEKSIEDAGRARIATHCESNWNKEWWTNLAEFASEAAKVLIDTSSNLVDTVGLVSDLTDVIFTPFYIGEGDCTPKAQLGNLIEGRKELIMTTNNPIDILMYSFGYEFVRGYGKWNSRAQMVSDYYLSAVLLGEDEIESGCCSHKITDYLIGVFPGLKILGIKVADGSENSLSDRQDQVGGHIRLWGPFYDLNKDFAGNYILDREWGQVIQESSNCTTLVNPLVSQVLHETENSTLRKVTDNSFFVYPNPTNEMLLFEGSYDSVHLYDITGKALIFLDGSETSMNLGHLASGFYLLKVIDKGSSSIYKIQKI